MIYWTLPGLNAQIYVMCLPHKGYEQANGVS